jgi:NADP-dependent 3-hydroxy acid dehydrogenase YdfG
MLLEGRNAVVYGAGGALGGAVSRAFAREGAAVFLTGRRRAPLDAVAAKIRAAGGAAETAVVDADAEQAVEEHTQAVVDRAGSLDISINLIGVDHIQGRPLVEMSPADFTLGLEARVRTHFVTARAAARHMLRQRSGAILMVTATPDRVAIPEVGSFGVANAAVEGAHPYARHRAEPARCPGRLPAVGRLAGRGRRAGGVRSARGQRRHDAGDLRVSPGGAHPAAAAADVGRGRRRRGAPGIGPGQRNDRHHRERDLRRDARLTALNLGVTGNRPGAGQDQRGATSPRWSGTAVERVPEHLHLQGAQGKPGQV